MTQDKNQNMDEKSAKSTHQAGTGFMMSLTEAIKKLQGDGYTENFIPRFNHFEARSGTIKLFPEDLVVDEMLRFENSSDPDDQSILFAFSTSIPGVKGLYVDSYGLSHDNLSSDVLAFLIKRKPTEKSDAISH